MGAPTWPPYPQPSGLPDKAVAALVNPIARVFLMPEVFADGANRDGAVGDGRGHAARRVVADVARREHTGQARLEHVGLSILVPPRHTRRAADDVAPRQDVPVLVTLKRFLQPRRVRAGAE